MSITSRISSMEEHVTNAYNGLAGLGADLTGIDKNIDNIASVLDDIYDDLPKVTGSGTSITLDDTRKGRLESTLSGNTSQFTTTGKNLLKNTLLTTATTTTGVTATPNSDGSVTLNGTASATTYFNLSQYDYGSTSFSSSYGGSTDYIASIGVTQTGVALGFNGSNKYTALSVNNGVTVNNLKVYPMIRAYSVSDDTFEPYTGGQASPNPDYPQEVHVISGDNEIEVCGKNLLCLEGITTYGYSAGIPTTQVTNLIIDSFDSNNITYHSTTADYCYALTNVIQLSPSTTYTISFSRTTTATNNQFFIYDYDNGTYTVNYRDNNTNVFTKTFTTNSVGKIVLAFGPSNTIGNTTISNIQLENGSSATTYEPYQGDTYNIDLPEGMELCSSQDGTKRDYFLHDKTLDKWYLHKEIGKIVLNGSENWQQSGTYTNNTIYSVYSGVIPNYSYGQGISNLFIWNFNISASTITEYMATGGDTLRIGVLKSRLSAYTINEFKTWLSNNNVTTYYVLATPTNIEITYQPLIDQLNELEKAMSKDGQTNISQVNNDLPFIISASALKEWQENTSLNSTLSMVNPLSLGNTLNTQEIDNNTQPIEVDNIEPLEEEENEES